ncbi:MAG: bifunctional demethylmenaquinone methyltransferase/2-methoxy-6-polyprenyl-1,4-benzoquinol methylase UbiE [Chitinophagaceae bacterium]|nr:bifunctional demethylmenaquinone methyltransferase/2-methoxy-6-polyprenyl-1,4-benzoquinol methylase UbiE [Chitinophagaceae bacterium]
MTTYKHDSIVPNEGSKVNKKLQVEQMFDNIAPKYDFLNRLMSLGIDIQWRKKVIKRLQAARKGQFLDVATGTADLAIMLASLQPKKVIGIDISQQMLNKGDEKIIEANVQDIVSLQKADSENLPFADNTFDAATVSFGARNFENLDKGLKEMYRVLSPGGILIILEFSKVKVFPLKQLFAFYFRYITPTIGKIFSKNNTAYSYLPESVAAFPEGEEMCSILHKIGFKNSTCTPLSFGIASIYQATK